MKDKIEQVLIKVDEGTMPVQQALAELLVIFSVSSSLPADDDMWKQEYDAACNEIGSLQDRLKEAESEIRDLMAELRNAN